MTTDNKEEMKDITPEIKEEVTMKDAMENTAEAMVINSGDVVLGTVLSVNEEEVLVNIGYMTDGVITKEEISNDREVKPTDAVKVGDQISVYIMKVNKDRKSVV